ncbi:(2Fe-2S)-binding protein [Archangium sp.]|uniref:(2Fe-2S)-binding protein n=1 Tax=Archangium sp. TaxID=1872627 RepID=UPI002D62C0B7|nr:(2Fe-2S)-binding protein [Archangium sp.]HYO59846.1 (2Fe-2S)-binding protein [Archangium sp.]
MKLIINDREYEVSDENPHRVLLWVLRDELGLAGTRFGCGVGMCGACTVHVNGVATRACLAPLSQLADARIRTVEGLARPGPDGRPRLHPVQRAFLDVQVPQCGWCMSGQMMTATALLERNPTPTPEQVVEAMDRNYCRCGTYTRIKKAVLAAADLLARETEP